MKMGLPTPSSLIACWDTSKNTAPATDIFRQRKVPVILGALHTIGAMNCFGLNCPGNDPVSRSRLKSRTLWNVSSDNRSHGIHQQLVRRFRNWQGPDLH